MLGRGLSGYISSILCMFVEDWGWIGVGRRIIPCIAMCVLFLTSRNLETSRRWVMLVSKIWKPSIYLKTLTPVSGEDDQK